MPTHEASRRTAHKERRIRILVAESVESPTLRSPERWERHGLEAVVAHDAMEALERFRDDAPNMVVLDDRLPGFEISGLVRIFHATSGRSSVPIILITHDANGKAAAEAAGADGFIPASEARGRLPEAVEHAVTLTRGSHR